MCGAYEALLLLTHKTFSGSGVSRYGVGGRAYSFVACLTAVIWPLTPHRLPDGAPFLVLTKTPPALLCSLRLPIHYMQPFVYLIPFLFRLSSPPSICYKNDRFLAMYLPLWCAKFVHITLVCFPHLRLQHIPFLLVKFTFSHNVYVLPSLALPRGDIGAPPPDSSSLLVCFFFLAHPGPFTTGVPSNMGDVRKPGEQVGSTPKMGGGIVFYRERFCFHAGVPLCKGEPTYGEYQFVSTQWKQGDCSCRVGTPRHHTYAWGILVWSPGERTCNWPNTIVCIGILHVQ